MAAEQAQSTKTRKIAAISAGALVIGLGAVYTLATWNDSEWVWGGADGGPGGRALALPLLMSSRTLERTRKTHG